MLTPTDIAEYGERHVEKWLKDNNFHCYHSVQHHGATSIEARSDETTLLVHVKTGLGHRAAPELSEKELHGICSRAMMLGYDAWLAKLQIDVQGELVGEIQWTKLN